MSTEAIDLAEIIDGILAASMVAKLPPVPSVIANTLAEVFFRDLRPQDYEEYRRQVLTAVLERLKVFLSQGRDFDFSGG